MQQETAMVSYKPGKQTGHNPISKTNVQKAPNKMELDFTIE